jgi:predicted HD superfamily hydrolase involved in NAD metabolism
MIDRLQQIVSPKRFQHSLNVSETATVLAKQYDCDVEKAKVASILHDYAKDFSKEQMVEACLQYKIPEYQKYGCLTSVIHGPIAAWIAKYEFLVEDIDVRNAIYFHTTGRPDMSLLEKVIYIADYIEPNRKFEGVEKLRRLAYQDLDLCMLEGLNMTIQTVVTKGSLLNPVTVEARNFYLDICKKKEK